MPSLCGTPESGTLATVSPQSQYSSTLASNLALCFAFFAVALALYWPALTGPFVSDDVLYIILHPWTAELSLDRTLGILDPTGEARFHQANYAPLHLLLTALERQVFGADPLGYHAVNVFLHAANAAMLTVVFGAVGIAPRAALLGGVLFLVHPANVEAVAWASQLKTNGALALSLAALLTLRRHPLAATLLFSAGLLMKASASVALPVAAALLWSRATPDDDRRSQWRWVLCWALLFALYCVPQISAFQPRGAVVVAAYADPLVHLYTIASIGLRYLLMALTTYGISHTPEHPPVLSILDPWVLCALPVAGLFIWRIAVTLRNRSVESAFWIGAAFAFAPRLADCPL